MKENKNEGQDRESSSINGFRKIINTISNGYSEEKEPSIQKSNYSINSLKKDNDNSENMDLSTILSNLQNKMDDGFSRMKDEIVSMKDEIVSMKDEIVSVKKENKIGFERISKSMDRLSANLMYFFLLVLAILIYDIYFSKKKI